MRSLLHLLLSLAVCSALFAQGPPAHAKKEPEPDPVGLKEPDQRMHILRLAERYKVAPELVEKARIAGIGMGEIDVVIDMAKMAKKEPEEVIELRKKGTTWPAIAELYGLKLEEVVKDEDSRHALIEGERNLAKQLAEQFKLTETTVAVYRAQLADWGEVKLVLSMADKGGVPVEVILAKVAAGHGFGTIAKEYNVSIGGIMRDPKSAENLGGPPTPHPTAEEKKEN